MTDTREKPVSPLPTISATKLSSKELGRISNLQIIVKEETPFLPKVAFTLISLASLGGAIFTGLGFGLSASELGLRWFAIWTLALAGGFLIWRLAYLKEVETGLDEEAVGALTSTALKRADQVSKVVGVLVLVSAVGVWFVSYLNFLPAARYTILAAIIGLGVLLLFGVSRRPIALGAAVLAGVLLVSWAIVDAGTDWNGLIRVLHLTAFTLWLGGALWNIGVAMPSGRQHPEVTAVLAGARQLDRFRWVVRFSLPTIIITGLIMASVFTVLPFSWWLTFPGILIPLKVLTIVALVVVFITCPLFRQCSPVQGVCNIEDLQTESKTS
ncbi:MAG: hypothetical protein KF808_01200 [Cryobacterium sp.]|nr:hypothetical protein [Cryobacterium sp.]